MKITPFSTELFYAQYEFSTPYQLCNSDCETLTIGELLQLAGIPQEQYSSLALGYTETLGHPNFRQAIAEAYEGVDSEDVVLLGTPIEGIYLTARALLNPGDEVIVLSPAYDALFNMFEHIVGSESVRKWEFSPGTEQWELDYDRLEGLISENTKMLVVNFPHNPTGYLPSNAQFKRLIEIVEDKEILLFCDEMYYGLVHSGTPMIDSAVECTDRAVILSGLSKTYGLPGLRTGWLVIKDEQLREQIINWKFYTSICASAPSEFLAMAAWKVRDKLRERSVLQIEGNLKLAEAFFQRWPSLFTWRRPMAASVALIGMKVPSVEAFAKKMADEAGVLIHPATTLGYDDQHMRMGFGRAGFPTALEKFENYLNSQNI